MDEKFTYCQACLSSDRNLIPLRRLEICLRNNSLWELMLMSVEGGVCWECNHKIRKFSCFREQVHKAQQILGHTKVPNISPLSKLSIHTVPVNQYYFSHNSLIHQEKALNEEISTKVLSNLDLEQDVTIKEELTDADTAIDKYCDNDSDKDTESKPSSKIFVEILNKKAKRCAKGTKGIEKETIDDAKDKFSTIVFNEEEMLKNREEKRNNPNFKKIPYKCDTCVLGFTKKENYDVHWEKKHDETVGPHTCPVCLVRFKCPRQAARHRDKHYVCYRCKLCKYDTAEMWSALSHVRTKHLEDRVESIHCNYCIYIAKTAAELSAHAAAEHAVYCHDCGAKFKALNTLKSHIRRIHTVKREFVCSICSRAYNTRSRLETHLATHSAALAARLAYCATCRVQYKNIHVYRNHLKTSANHAQQSYECEQCNKRFASKVYWKKHYNFYHLHKSQFHCDICNKLFISDWRLKNHRQTQHGLSRSRDHHCSECGKQFFTLSTLRGHQLTHSEQRSYMCEDCGDTFKQRPALYTHARLVHRGLARKKRTNT